MATLRVDFQDGFQDDEVVVSVDRVERVRRAGLTTKRVIGLAGHETIDVEPGKHTVLVSVPTRGFDTHIDVNVEDAAYVGVSIMAGGIAVIARGEPFGYG
ncbi:MAG: hypothetical protein JO093_11655 [Acidobacteria bacterium]|nr:hypothetical protein [Acidobacteriota bacterium]MBV9067903.1 hypothetical protein [Acidobacteriota bacterium]MBV9186273.1 hypothetical protein [Acidobacteriota bacterium]